MYLLKNELYSYFSADKVSEVVEYDLSLAEMSSNHCELYYLWRCFWEQKHEFD